MNDNPILISTVKMPTVIQGNIEELPIFVAPFDCFLRTIYFTNDINSDGNMTVSFQRKGSGGDGSDPIASLTVTSGSVDAHLPKDVGALHKDYRYIPKGTAVTYLKGGTSEAMTDPIFSVVFSRA